MIIVLNLQGSLPGHSSLLWNGPAGIFGHAEMTALMEVVSVPVAARRLPAPQVFRWGQPLEPGTLAKVLATGPALYYDPTHITYSFYRVLTGGLRVPVGPPMRTPVRSDVGHYYATWTAGELGQPGEWEIEWRWQIGWGDSWTTSTERFVVQDAVAAGVQDPARHTKYGWL